MKHFLFWRAPALCAGLGYAFQRYALPLLSLTRSPSVFLTQQAFFGFFGLIASLLFSCAAYAQKFDNVWFIGSHGAAAVFRFDNGVMQLDTMRNIPFWGTNSSMCDSFGNLLFYTNGLKIYNRQYQLMENGDSLNPGYMADHSIANGIGYGAAETSIAIPHPNQENKYYLFHTSEPAPPPLDSPFIQHAEFLRYTLVDINANNGQGRVEQKNQILLTLSDSVGYGQLEAVKHANGRDWWLIQHKAFTNVYYIFLIQGDSIRLVREQRLGNIHFFSPIEWYGQAVFSPDGSKYARYDWRHDLEIMDFDRCTGELSNYVHIPLQDTCDNWGGFGGQAGCACGLAFSSSGNNLYVASMTNLYQYDMWSADVAASRQTVAVYDGYVYVFPTYFWYMQLAPDGKIYMTTGGTQYMHVIDYPDFSGVSCGVRQHSIFLYNPSSKGLPNFPHYRTPALQQPCEIGVREEQGEQAALRVYPVPARTVLHIESSVPLPAGTPIAIYNTLGQQVYSSAVAHETDYIELSVQGWQAGYYLLRVGARSVGVVVGL